MRYIVVIFCCISLPLLVKGQQISNYLFHAIPTNTRPANKAHITLQELSNIMANAKWHIINDDVAIKELDALCSHFAMQYTTIINKKERLEFLYNLSAYWIGRVKNNVDSSLKYNLLFNEETKGDIKGIEALAGCSAMQQVFNYSSGANSNYRKAYENNIKALAIFHTINDSVQICKCCLLLTKLYTKLDLYNKASQYLDSANTYDTKAKNQGISLFRFNCSAALFLKQYAEKGGNNFKDSVNKIINYYSDTTRDPEINEKYFQSSFFFAKAQLHYFQKKYLLSLSNIDTVYFILGNIASERNDDAYKIFKGLNLIQLNKVKEGIKMLESVKPNMDYNYTGLMLAEIYKYEKQKGNLAKALDYHEKMMAFNANQQQLSYQGQILEMEQQYNVAARDKQIVQLNARQEKVLYVIVLISILTLALIGFIIVRHRNSKRKTQQLLSQIDYLTQLQIVRIEEAAHAAEEKERKRIGQELHDDLSASLAGVLHYMRTKMSMETNPVEKKGLEKACAIIEDSYIKTRSKSHDVFYRETEGQFISTITDNLNIFFNGTGIQLNTEIDSVGMEELSATVKTSILLTIKEAIANIIKHAKASKVNLLLYNSNNTVYVEVDDDGIGLSKKMTNNKSLGLYSIKQRIEAVGGRFVVESKTTGGTVLKVMTPVG